MNYICDTATPKRTQRNNLQFNELVPVVHLSSQQYVIIYINPTSQLRSMHNVKI
jgi:hypothetical protein